MIDYLSRWRYYWDRFEAALGLIAVFVLVYGPLTVAALGLIFSLLLGEWSSVGITALVTAITCPMAVWITRMADAALKKMSSQAPSGTGYVGSADNAEYPQQPRRLPLAILIVAELPRLPLSARLPLAFWWFAHFAAAGVFVYFNSDLFGPRMFQPGLGESLLMVAVCYCFQFAANLFLVLAVAVGFESPTITAQVWRKRFLIDALLTVPVVMKILF